MILSTWPVTNTLSFTSDPITDIFSRWYCIKHILGEIRFIIRSIYQPLHDCVQSLLQASPKDRFYFKCITAIIYFVWTWPVTGTVPFTCKHITGTIKGPFCFQTYNRYHWFSIHIACNIHLIFPFKTYGSYDLRTDWFWSYNRYYSFSFYIACNRHSIL